MSESQLSILRRHGIRPIKRRGQNFLLDGNLARAIAVEVAAIADEVLELGAGGGALTGPALTGPLLDLCPRVTCVEVDRRLCDLLEAEMGSRPGFSLLAGDLSRLDWPTVLQQAGPRPVVAGNLPYVLTSQVLFALAEHQARVAGAVLMVQKEVADRLTARPGGRDHGVLAVVMGSFFEIACVRPVAATVFWPRPEVASAVVRLLPREPWPAAEYRSFLAVVKAVFQNRRKQMGTVLRRLYPLDELQVEQLLQQAGCRPDQRPEQLTCAAWRDLAGSLATRGLA